MYIELAERLRCPASHDPDPYCVLLPEQVRDRMVTAGSVGCPICQREYPIEDGTVVFGSVADVEMAADVPEADAVQALLHLSGPGGYVVLVGSVATVVEPLIERQSGVHFVIVNAPHKGPSQDVTHIQAPDSIPLKSGTARGAVIGSEYAMAPWLSEAIRIVSRGGRVLVISEIRPPDGVTPLAVGQGMFLGERGA